MNRPYYGISLAECASPMSNRFMSQNDVGNPGRVYLVGAGPGDPRLITLRGVDCLKRADVIIYDYLVNPQILKHAPPEAERICLGSHGKRRTLEQSEVNQRMVDLARQGKTVVRLKGGDPMVFGRLSEETECLAANGIPFEIVPGITAALAAGSYAGIPFTHRDIASAVALVTAQENSEKVDSTLDYAALAMFPGTLVFYMGVTTAANWTKALIEAGKPPDTPVAIVRRCSFPDQLTLRCRLDEIVEKLTPPVRIRPPAIVIVGQVAQSPDTLSWFERQPLIGQRIVVTRPADQSGTLAERLEELGAQVFVQPAITISDPPDWRAVDEALKSLPTYDWLVFSSSNGVRYVLNRLLATGGDLRRLGGVRLGAIGPGTCEALSHFHLKADLVPEEYRAEALAGALANQSQTKRVLLARASRGRDVLPERLRTAGVTVDQVVVYSSTDVTCADEEIARLLAAGRIDWLTVTSSAIARSLVAMFGADLGKTRLASISPITSETLRESGYNPAVEASIYTMDGVVDAILNPGHPNPEPRLPEP
jgi:uroporphyrinogen III methyltransferase/synthase